MNVRIMTKEDVPFVEQMEQQIFSRPWSQRGFFDALENPAALFLVAEEEENGSTGNPAKEIAGYIGTYIALDEGEITNVAVSESFRGRGIGNLLVQSMICKARRQAVTRIVLEVRCSNQPAIHLYEKNAFVKVGVRRGFYEAPREDADIMVWEEHAG